MNIFSNFLKERWFEISILSLGITSFLFVLNLDYFFPAYSLAKEYTITTLTTIPLFFITIINLYWGVIKHRKTLEKALFDNSQSLEKAILDQKSTIIREYVSGFHTNEFLQRIYFDLVYSYSDTIYDKLVDDPIYKTDPPPIRPCFPDSAQTPELRDIGSRYYHPNFFQFSLEEKKLDSLLGFFDVVAYQYVKELISLEDIVGTVGYYLEIINTRKASNEYLNLIDREWEKTDYGKSGAKKPYTYLRILLKALADEKQKVAKEIKDEKLKAAQKSENAKTKRDEIRAGIS